MPAPVLVGPVFCNDGGPMLVLSRHLLADWHGAPDEDAVGGDYGRAIEADGCVSRVSVASDDGVVFGNDPDVMTAQWIRLGVTWLVVGWSCGEEDSDARLLERLRTDRIQGWAPLVSNQRVEGGLVLFHPASSAEDFRSGTAHHHEGTTLLSSSREPAPPVVVGIGEAIVAPVPDGAYDVEWTRVKLEDESDCTLCRWTPRQ